MVRSISSVKTVKHSTELVRNITIKLGYANAKGLFLLCEREEGNNVLDFRSSCFFFSLLFFSSLFSLLQFTNAQSARDLNAMDPSSHP